MLNLIKYEWLRRWKFFLAGIVIYIAANVNLVSNATQQADPTTLTVILISLCFALSVVLFIDHVGRLYRSLFSDEGYLEFSLPIRGYRFLGGKLIAVIFECIAVIAIISITIYLDVLYLAKTGPHPVNFSFVLEEWLTLVQLILLLLAVYISFLLTVYLSMTLSKTLFASFKHGKLIAFGCFLAITKVIDIVTQQPVSSFEELPIQMSDVIFSGADWLTTGAVMIVLFLSTSYLLDRRINL